MGKGLCSKLFPVVLTVVLVFSLAAASYERLPVEGNWVVEGARAMQVPSSPLTYHALKGDPVVIRFIVEPGDMELFNGARRDLSVPEALQPKAIESVFPGEIYSYKLEPSELGDHDIEIKIESAERGFKLSYAVRITVHGDLASVQDCMMPPPPPIPLVPSPAGIDANPGNSLWRKEFAPAEYAHVHGLALTYAYPDNRRYMLRGLRMELRDGETVLGTLNTSDQLGEGRWETEFSDYVDESDDSYHHATTSGQFDFGEVYVGASGKTLILREIFQFYSGSDGTSLNGTQRFKSEDSTFNQVTLDWAVTFASGQENQVWLRTPAFVLSATNGSLADEAMHVQLDAARMYHFFAEGIPWESPTVTSFIIDLADTSSPHCGGVTVNLTGWNNDYLSYAYTDSIRHEYTHSLHWKMRGGSFPPFTSGGSTNHGGCSNPHSADSLGEGYARYIPTAVFRTGNSYDWTATSTTSMDICGDYCESVPDDRHEWAVGRALWRSAQNSGAPDSFFACSGSALDSGDADYVEDYFNDIVSNCPNDRSTWDGFWCSAVNYDTTAPSNPSPIFSSASPEGWVNEASWSWLEPFDDLSGILGYSVLITPGTVGVLPDDTRDIDAVNNYSPAATPADGPYYFSIRTQDRALNWNSGFTGQFINIDTVNPGLATNLIETAPPELNSWSNWPYLSPQWTPATDDRSGLDGYSWAIVAATTELPDSIKDIEENATVVNTTLSSGSATQYFALRSKDNAGNWSNTAAYLGPYLIDVDPPGMAEDFSSTSHTPGTWSNDTTVDFAWLQAPDSHSGIQGYSICADTLACTPAEAMTMGNVSSTTINLAHGDVGYFVSLRAIDNAGNWGNSWPTTGPILIDTVNPTTPGDVSSATHPTGNCVTGNSTMIANWTSSYDGNSGITAYAYTISTGDWQRPPEEDHLPAGTTFVEVSVPNSTQQQFFNIMARDAAGNWSDFIGYGPFMNDRTPLPVGNLILSLPEEPAGSLQIDWNGTGEIGYSVEWVTGFDDVTPEDWADNPNYGIADTTVQAYTHNSPPVAQCVFYRVRGKNACGVLGE